MVFQWNAHRFSGGRLAFDLANTVVLRDDPARRIDRLAERDEIPRFMAASQMLCSEVVEAPPAQTVDADPATDMLLVLREAIDRHFRDRVTGGGGSLAPLLSALAAAESTGNSFLQACVRSTLALLAEPTPERIKLCRHCGWLYYDRSKNRSRNWCDMSVCGNRIKASRHYRRRREGPAA